MVSQHLHLIQLHLLMLSYINTAVSNKEYCIALYMDISKAFDCINQNIINEIRTIWN